MRDWRPEIVELVQIKQQIDDADTEGLWEYHLPKVAATEEDLRDAEVSIGARLDPQYRDFLAYANGWPSFFQTVDLFGTDDLGGGPRFEIAQEGLDAVDPLVFERAGLRRAAVVPIASTTEDLDVFVMAVDTGTLVPPVVWLAGDEIDRFPSFEAYLLAMVEYNRRELATLTGG